MALGKLLPQLRPSDQALAETQPRSGGGRKTEAWEAVPVELAAAKEFHEVAGLAPLDLLMTLDLAHKRGRCVCAEETCKDEISLHAGGVRNQGTILPGI